VLKLSLFSSVRVMSESKEDQAKKDVENAIAENEFAQKLLDTPLRKVYERIVGMVGKKMWDQKFVAKLLHGFEQCLKALDADYDTIDLLTWFYYVKLPDVEESY